MLKKEIPENVTLLYQSLVDKDAYIHSIEQQDCAFEMIVIDGRDHRLECTKVALPWLSENGVFLLDDSNRSYTQGAVQFLLDQGFRVIEFTGIKPSENGEERSAVFYRDDNCLNI